MWIVNVDPCRVTLLGIWNGVGYEVGGVVAYGACCQCQGGNGHAYQHFHFLHNVVVLFNHDFLVVTDVQTLGRSGYTLSLQVIEDTSLLTLCG